MAKPEFKARENEEIFAEKVSGDCWKTPEQTIGRQVSGKLYFTDQRIVFIAGGLLGIGSVSWEISMKDISRVEKCFTPPCFPFGILLTLKDGGEYKLGILKRGKYIDWIAQHISR